MYRITTWCSNTMSCYTSGARFLKTLKQQETGWRYYKVVVVVRVGGDGGMKLLVKSERF